jgi:signal peptidase II
MAARLYAYAVALAIFLADRLSKVYIQSHVPAWDTRAVIPGFFNIIHTENPGAAFSLFSEAHSGWRTFFLVVVSTTAMIVVATLLWHPTHRTGDSRFMRLGLAFILGGALGNLYDRLFRGAVTDFLEFYIRDYRWPAFNVADTALTVGALLVVVAMLRTRRAPGTT